MSAESITELCKHAIKNPALPAHSFSAFLLQQPVEDVDFAVRLLLDTTRRGAQMLERAHIYIETTDEYCPN